MTKQPPDRVPEDPRVELAFSRTHLANERTYAAWLRTGLSIAAAGYGIARLVPVPRREATYAALTGGLLVFIGAVLIIMGAWSYRQTHVRLCRAGAPPTPIVRSTIYAVSASLALLLLLALLLIA